MSDEYITMDQLRARIRRKPLEDKAKQVGAGARAVGNGVVWVAKKSWLAGKIAVAKGDAALGRLDSFNNSAKAKRLKNNIDDFWK